jgi:hypothetical protein
MKFYILFKHEGLREALELGDLSFKTFYGETGLEALEEILDLEDAAKYLDRLIIKDEKSKEYTVDEFLDILETSNVFTQKGKENKRNKWRK